MFPRDVEDGFAFSTSAFRLQGAFAPCVGAGDLDPGSMDVSVQVGQFRQTFPAGSLRADRRPEGRWRYRAPNRFGEITELVLQHDRKHGWSFEIAGRRQPRALILPRGPEVELRLAIGASEGTSREALQERRMKLFFRGEPYPCRADSDKLLAGATTPASGIELLPIAPAFEAPLTLRLRAHEAGPVRLVLYDVRGRQLRVLAQGVLAAGEQVFLWDGRDGQGVLQSSGVYFVRLTTASGGTTRKLLLAK